MTHAATPTPAAGARAPAAAAGAVGPAVAAGPAGPSGPSGPSATTGPEQPSFGTLVSQASTHMSVLIRSEIELAKLELRSSVKNAGVGIGMFAAAAVVLVFSLTFGLLALAEGLAAAGLDRWLAFLIVFGLLLLLVGLLAFLGVKKVKKVRAPERTIQTSKDTVAYLKNH